MKQSCTRVPTLAIRLGRSLGVQMSAMYALAADIVPEHAPINSRDATNHVKLGASDEPIMPMPAPPRVTVRMARRPTWSDKGPIQPLESSCANANAENMNPSAPEAPPSRLHTGSVHRPLLSSSQPHTRET